MISGADSPTTRRMKRDAMLAMSGSSGDLPMLASEKKMKRMRPPDQMEGSRRPTSLLGRMTMRKKGKVDPAQAHARWAVEVLSGQDGLIHAFMTALTADIRDAKSGAIEPTKRQKEERRTVGVQKRNRDAMYTKHIFQLQEIFGPRVPACTDLVTKKGDGRLQEELKAAKAVLGIDQE